MSKVSEKHESLNSIIWDNWGIVEVLTEQREKIKNDLLDALLKEIQDEESFPENERPKIFAEVRRRTAGRGVEAKFFLNQPNGDDQNEEYSEERISLGAITIDFPGSQDGRISLEISASLPHQLLFGKNLQDSKNHIRQKVKSINTNFKAKQTESISDADREVVNINDLDRATGRNDIAIRPIPAAEFEDFQNEDTLEKNINEFSQLVMGIYKVYKQIPRWLVDLDSSPRSNSS